MNLDCEYGAYDVEKEQLGERMEDFKKKGFSGINVTIPHKVDVIKYLDELSVEAKLTGAVNTVKFGRKNIGYNTDGIGCLAAFKENGIELEGKRVLIIGAGGAARAISFQLAGEKAEIWITDMVSEKAVDLSKEIREQINGRIQAIYLDDKLSEKINEVDIVVNATPIGMYPNTNEMPIDAKQLKRGTVVMDIIYNPVETMLLKEAEKRGCKTISGVEMFINQGAESLRIWLGIEPPIELMRKTVLAALKTGK
jgi:shikimate dehydrogenase